MLLITLGHANTHMTIGGTGYMMSSVCSNSLAGATPYTHYYDSPVDSHPSQAFQTLNGDQCEWVQTVLTGHALLATSPVSLFS